MFLLCRLKWPSLASTRRTCLSSGMYVIQKPEIAKPNKIMYMSYFLFTSLCPVGWRALLPVVCHRSLHCYLHWHGQLWEAACWSTFCGTHADSWTDICPIFYNASGFLMTKIVDSFSFLLNKLCLHQWLTNSQSFVKSVTIHMNCDSSFMNKNAPPSFFVLWEGDLVKWVCFFHLGWALSVNTYGEKCKECYNCVIVFYPADISTTVFNGMQYHMILLSIGVIAWAPQGYLVS